MQCNLRRERGKQLQLQEVEVAMLRLKNGGLQIYVGLVQIDTLKAGKGRKKWLHNF